MNILKPRNEAAYLQFPRPRDRFFYAFSDRTAEDMTGKGKRKWGNDTLQRVAGGNQTHVHRRGPIASVHEANALLTELTLRFEWG